MTLSQIISSYRDAELRLKARAINFWHRHIRRHPAAIARRVESARARKARQRSEARAAQAIRLKACRLRIEIAAQKAGA